MRYNLYEHIQERQFMSTYKKDNFKMVRFSDLQIGDVVEPKSGEFVKVIYRIDHEAVVVLRGYTSFNLIDAESQEWKVVEGPSLRDKGKTFYKASYNDSVDGSGSSTTVGYTDNEAEAKAWVVKKNSWGGNGSVNKVTVFTDGTYFRFEE